MGRKMMKMERIANEKTRTTTYKKRKRCLFKKAWEFSTLCGVETCVIVYGPNRTAETVVAEAEIWPEDPNKVQSIINKYRDTASSSCRKTFHMNDFLSAKTKNTDGPIQKPNRIKYQMWDEKLEKCSQEELLLILVEIEDKIQEAANRVSFLEMKKQIRVQNLVEASQPVNPQSFCGYNNGVEFKQECFEQKLPALPPLKQVSHPYLHCNDPMSSNFTGMVPVNFNLTETAEAMMMLRGNNIEYNKPFSRGYGGSEVPYSSMMQGSTYFEPYWMQRNIVFNNVNQFTSYCTLDPLAAQMSTQSNEWEDSSRII